MNTILFDLDGTLLPMNIDVFEKIYLGEMAKCFADIEEPNAFIKKIWESTKAMVENLEEHTNEEVFMMDFKNRINGDWETYRKRFDEFYDNGYLMAEKSAMPNPIIKQSIKMLKEKGYNIVIATNPIFPYKAILHRIKWAGLDVNDFIYVSNYEHNHFCKPQTKFYEEILSEIGKMPEECMMVGNDVQEDLIAAKLGLKTFLIENHMIHRTADEIIADYKGDYENFFEFVQELPKIR